MIFCNFRTKAEQTGKHLRGDRSSGDASARAEVVPVERQTVPKQDTVNQEAPDMQPTYKTKCALPRGNSINTKVSWYKPRYCLYNCSYAYKLMVVKSERDDF